MRPIPSDQRHHGERSVAVGIPAEHQDGPVTTEDPPGASYGTVASWDRHGWEDGDWGPHDPSEGEWW